MWKPLKYVQYRFIILGGPIHKYSNNWGRVNVQAKKQVSINEHMRMDFFPSFGVMSSASKFVKYLLSSCIIFLMINYPKSNC